MLTGKRTRTRSTLTNNMKLGADVFKRSQTTQDSALLGLPGWPNKPVLIEVSLLSTYTEAVLSGSKSCPVEGRYALAHWTDTITTHVYSHDRAGTPHRAPRSIRI
jgi:hypothetical protein